jgi:hypothetical protein
MLLPGITLRGRHIRLQDFGNKRTRPKGLEVLIPAAAVVSAAPQKDVMCPDTGLWALGAADVAASINQVPDSINRVI